MAMTWAEKFEAQTLERGLREGRREGMREVLLHLLERRFSPLPDEVSRRVSAIDSKDELTRLAERVLSARSLDELGLA